MRVDQAPAMELHSTRGMEKDELYQQSLAHLQQGQWEQAMEAILHLQQQYGDTSEVEALLQEARFKAALDREPLALQRPWWREQWERWRPLAPWFLLGLLALVALVASVLVYQRTIVPARLARQEELRLAQLRQQGQSYLATRQYDQAIQVFKDLLVEVPDDQIALQGIATAEEKQQLEALYQRTIELLEAGEWEAALHIMDKIRARKPDYGGLADKRALAEKQLHLEEAFEEAEAAYSVADWDQAQLKYEQLQALDRSFERVVVTGRLFEAYVHRGRELVATAGESLDPVEDARELFAKALVLRPGEPQVVAERNWAEAYIEGRQAHERGDWERATEALGQLYTDRPDYAGGKVGPLLYEAYLRNGQAHEAQSDLSRALAQYQRALEVGGVDHSEAEARIAALGPTPTPSSVEPAEPVIEASTPTPTVQPTPGWRYNLTFMGGRPNCVHTGVGGVIRDHDGVPVAGVQVRLWNSAASSWISSASDVDGQYEIIVADEPVADTWTVCVMEGGQPISPFYSFRTSPGCVNGLQEYRVDWQRSE